MLEQYFRSVRVQQRIRYNPLHKEIRRLVEYLDRRGHPSSTIQHYVQSAEHFGLWLASRQRQTSLTGEAVDRFIKEHLPRCHCQLLGARYIPSTRAALRHLLRACGKDISASAKPSCLAVERLVSAYIKHMSNNCGLAAETQHYRTRYAREFLENQYKRRRLNLKDLKAEEVIEFITDYAVGKKRSSMQVAACALRSFLHFLQMRGLCKDGVVRAVPHIAQWKLSHVPRVLTSEQLRNFLAAFDRSTACGRRDYALAVCMVELGLRVSEVIMLDLCDINWRDGIIEVHSTKERRIRQLPITKSVGKAITSYLKYSRPTSLYRKLFLRHSVPIGAAISKALVRGVMRRAFARSGMPANWTGTHILRHTAATRLYERGAALKEIADLLGHRSLDTSTIYTKVNLSQLASVALPWPEVQI